MTHLVQNQHLVYRASIGFKFQPVMMHLMFKLPTEVTQNLFLLYSDSDLLFLEIDERKDLMCQPDETERNYEYELSSKQKSQH